MKTTTLSSALSLLLTALTVSASFDQIRFNSSASTPSTPSSLSKHTAPSNIKVSVQLGVMSRCPDARFCESVFADVLHRAGNKVDLEMLYIGSLNATEKYGVSSKHGPTETAGNVQQLCVAAAWNDKTGKRGGESWRDAWEFIQCQNRSYDRVGEPSLVKECVKEVGRDYNDPLLQACLKNNNGQADHIIQDSVVKTASMNVTKSCTILIEEKIVCIHDSTWYDCPMGHEVNDFVRVIEKIYDTKNGV